MSIEFPQKHVLARIDGWPITIPDLKSAVHDVMQAAKSGKPFTVFTLNLDHLVKLRRSEAFQHAYRGADFVTADGAPVAALAGREHKAITRTTGADLLLPLAAAAAEARLPVFLFGSSAAVMARAGRELSERTDGALDIAGTLAPSETFDPAGAEADKALQTIQRSGAKLCFVALGAPKQEIFAARAKELGTPCGFVCIGASLDFIAGAQVRAPEFMQKHGLEWLWRLSTNPRRLFRRYYECAVLLADLVLVEPLRHRTPRAKI